MSDDPAARVEASFRLVNHRGPELADRFYAALFARHPQLRSLFPAAMHEQKQKLLSAVMFVVKNVRRPDALRKPLVDLGRRHHLYGAQPEHYPILRDTLIDVIAELAGDGWTPQLTSDWKAALNCVAAVMLEGHRIEEKAAAATP